MLVHGIRVTPMQAKPGSLRRLLLARDWSSYQALRSVQIQSATLRPEISMAVRFVSCLAVWIRYFRLKIKICGMIFLHILEPFSLASSASDNARPRCIYESAISLSWHSRKVF